MIAMTNIYDEVKDLLLSPDRPDSKGMIWSFCPVHEADGSHHRRSLSVHPVKGLTCWAGCTRGDGFKQVVDALYARSGKQNNGKVNRQADVPVASNPVPSWLLRKHPGAKFVAAYEYRDPYTEELIAVHGRFEWADISKEKGYDKTFLWRLPDGEYHDGLNNQLSLADVPLYGGERVVSNPGKRVWVVEGEKSVHALQSLGEVAVSGGGGSGQRSFGESLAILKDRDLFLVPDNDTPGAEYVAHLRHELVGVGPRTVRVLSLPVPPKGDIVEFLRDGGDIKSLTEGFIEEPTIEIVTNDHFVVRVPAANGKVYQFDCSQINYSSRELNCEIAVSNVPAAKRSVPFVRRINLLSSSAIDSIARILPDFFGTGKEANWASVVNTVVAMVSAARKGQSRGKRIDELSQERGVSWLVESLVPSAAPVILFGDGESCKTWLAYSLGIAMALGSGTWNGKRVLTGGVLIVDYETNERQMRERVSRLLDGEGLEPDVSGLPIYWWEADSMPIHEQTEEIAEFCQKNNVRLVIIDAAADACGGEPEKAVVALQYFNALNRIQSLSGASTLSIAHLTHAAVLNELQKPQVPFGSRFFRNRARMLWRADKVEGHSAQAMTVTLTNTKFNDGPRPGPFAFRIEFDDPEGQVTVRNAPFTGEALRQSGTAGARIRDFLWHAGASKTVGQIVEATGINKETVRTELKRGLGRQYANLPSDDGSTEGRWGILTRNGE